MRQEEQVPRPQMDPSQLLARSQYPKPVALLLSKDPALQGQHQFGVAVPDDYSSSPFFPHCLELRLCGRTQFWLPELSPDGLW